MKESHANVGSWPWLKLSLSTILSNLLDRLDRAALAPYGTLTGVSYDVYPWHEYAALSFRLSSDDRDDIAAWTHFEAVRSLPDELQAVSDWYGAGGDRQRERAHFIFLAAAHALLSDQSQSALQAMMDEPNDGPFVNRIAERIVTDPDQSVAFNYCEFVTLTEVHQALERVAFEHTTGGSGPARP